MATYWKRIVIAGVAIELLYAVYVYYLTSVDLVGYKPEGLAVAFILFAIGGLWAAWPAQASRLAIGLAVGLVGMVFYYAISLPTLLAGEMEFPLMAWVNHACKLAGGGVGALAAGAFARRSA